MWTIMTGLEGNSSAATEAAASIPLVTDADVGIFGDLGDLEPLHSVAPPPSRSIAVSVNTNTNSHRTDSDTNTQTHHPFKTKHH